MRTSITAAPIITAWCLSLLLLPCGCDTTNSGGHYYERIGELTFRRSFAGHEDWDPGKRDSVRRSNPTVPADSAASGAPAFDVLRSMGLTSSEALLLDSAGQGMGDTILVHVTHRGYDTVCLAHEPMSARTIIDIRNGGLADQHALPWAGPSRPALIAPRTSGQRAFAVVEHHYIMNGDNYKVTVFRGADTRCGEK